MMQSASFSQLIRNYITQGTPRKALLLYTQIRQRKDIQTHHHHHHHHQSGVLLILPLLLKACASLSILHHGKALHAETIKIGFDYNVIIGTTLISMYSKCHQLVDSRRVFDEMPDRNVVTWNAMLGGYSKSGDMVSAMILFEQMQFRTSVTWSEMVDGFARKRDTVSARRIFDQAPREMRNVVTWTVMVDGYVSNGEMEAARSLFDEMPQRNFFVWSSMISGYCKKGEVNEAKLLFGRIPVRNLVNWNSLIAGYAQNGLCEDALDAFEKMQVEGFEPDEVTVASALSACAQLGSLNRGKEIHDLIDRRGIKLNQFVLNGLVDMYAKCGDVLNASRIFKGMVHRNDVCWNAMITGFAAHGQSAEALELFRQMEESTEKPNDVTFLSVLWACAHGGFVKEGLEIFSKMKDKYALVANVKHYGCVVDILGRAGRLQEAYNLIKEMPVKPNDAVWGALLGACRIHSDMEMVDKVMKEAQILHSGRAIDNDAQYVLLSNIFAASELWEKAENLRAIMVKNGIQKTPGCSSIMLGNAEHRFHAGVVCHNLLES